MTKLCIQRYRLFLIGVLFEFLAGVFAIILSLIFKYKIFSNVKINTSEFTKGVLYAIPVMIFFYALFKIPSQRLKQIEITITNFVHTILGNCSVIHFAIISIVAGVCEELLFRGFLQGFFSQKLGLLPSIILTNLAFGLMHPVSYLYSLITFIAGCYFSMVLHFEKNLFVLMVTHSLYDFIALCYIKFRKENHF